MQNSNIVTRTSLRRTVRTAVFIAIALLLLSVLAIGGWTAWRLADKEILPAGTAVEDLALAVYHSHYKTNVPELSPWNSIDWEYLPQPQAEHVASGISATAAILIDAITGDILLEKNADFPIPPASMTKIVAMYTALKAVDLGEISLDDRVDLPPESWAVNIPAGSSLMFLDHGQLVTVRELLLGMSVVSGNDAAIAIAYHVSGSVPAFIERMNQEMQRIGLVNTRFVEPSGLSEYNMTTAREFAQFARIYIAEYPHTLSDFHSKTEFAYPLAQNLPTGKFDTPIWQRGTNRLLGLLKGCDGLKTGFIYESGYNLALTAKRNGTRLLSITLGGAGRGSFEGNQNRVKDGTNLMEWGFSHFSTIHPTKTRPVPLRVWKGQSVGLCLIPVEDPAITSPSYITEKDLTQQIWHPAHIEAPVEAGTPLGIIEYREGNKVVKTIDLIADRNVEKSGGLVRLADTISIAILTLLNL